MFYNIIVGHKNAVCTNVANKTPLHLPVTAK